MKLTRGIYAYCIVKTTPDAYFKDLLSGEIFAVRYQGVAAIVCNVFKSSWQPTKNNIMRHQKIISKVQEKLDILPLRFGVIFKDVEEVEKVLKEKYVDILQLFSKIEGRIELGLRIFWNHEAFLKEIGDKKVEKLKKEYALGKKDRYLIALEAGKIIEAAVIQKRDEYIKEIFKPLSEMSDDSLLNPVSGEKMVFNAAFLVKEQKLSDFDEAVKKLHDYYKDRFIFKYSGPWPPFNFVNVNL